MRKYLKYFRNTLLLAVIPLTLGGYLAYRSNLASMQDINLVADDLQVIAEGAAIYERSCASCHGANLQGESKWNIRKADGKMPVSPLDQFGPAPSRSDEYLFIVTKYGYEDIDDKPYPTNMPRFATLLSDDEIVAVLSFIKSTWPKSVQEKHDLIQQNK